jgi:pSer/pThr/pTyr-binding forkhead associated (FHA) protein
MERPKDCDYLMLEKLEINSRNILILNNLPSEGLSIGRGGSCYIKIVDNTISRKPHAFIQYKGGNFYIFDNQSKFGTIVVEEPFRV